MGRESRNFYSPYVQILRYLPPTFALPAAGVALNEVVDLTLTPFGAVTVVVVPEFGAATVGAGALLEHPTTRRVKAQRTVTVEIDLNIIGFFRD